MTSSQTLVQNFILFAEQERVKAGLTQQEMADKLEMSLSGYKKMICGETSRINLYTANLLHKLTGKWIFEMIKEEEGETHEIAKKLRLLSDSQIRFVKEVVELEAAFAKNLEDFEKDTDDYISVLIPTGNMEDGMVYDSCNITRVNAEPYRKLFGSDLDCGLQITSIHMAPAYNTGDILLLSRRPIRDGDTGVFLDRETSRIYIRKFKQTSPCCLEPITDYGKPITFDPCSEKEMRRWLRLGRVLTKMRCKEPEINRLKKQH